MTEDLRYPIGNFAYQDNPSAEQVQEWIAIIENTPADLRAAVAGLNDEQLDTPYRPDGWTVRQVVHHLPDSHMNSYIRFKLALTEDNPLIRPYEEKFWAEQKEACSAPIEMSLRLLDAIHERLNVVLRNLQPDDLKRTFRHPEIKGAMSIEKNIALYAWHGPHHVAHITSLRKRKGW